MSDESADRWVDYVDLDEIRLAPRNPKLHDAPGIERSVSHFGLAELPTRDERTGRLVAGHGRIADLRERHTAGKPAPAGVRTDGDRWLVPVLAGWASATDADAEAYLLYSNKSVENGGWDDAALRQMLADAVDVDAELALLAGFDSTELAQLLDAYDDEPPDELGEALPPDDFPEYDEKTIATEHTCPSCGYQWSGGKLTIKSGGE